MKNKTVLTAAAIVALASTAGAVALTGAGESDAGQKNAGTRVAAYLGTDISPTEWQPLAVQHATFVDDCMADKGLEHTSDPVEVDAYSDLKVSDPVAFANEFGYGAAEGYKNAAVPNDDPGKEDPRAGLDPHEFETYVGELDNCAQAATAEFIEPHLAPTAVHQRYAQLRQEAGTTPLYLAAAAEWRACMTTNGLDADNPLSTEGLIHEVALEMSGLPISPPGHDNPDEIVLQLNDKQLRDLQAFELTVFATDQQCKQNSGLEAAMYELETDILDNLSNEFPDFGGVERPQR